MEKQMKIAFIYYDFSSFVKQDRDLLARHFEVKEVNYRKLLDIFKIVAAIWKSDASFSWFASGHSFAAVLTSMLLGKKSFVVAGGYDVARVPEIDYGQFTESWTKRMMTVFSLKHADFVLPVSYFTSKEVARWAKPKSSRIIYNGIDDERFKPGPKKNDLIITVSNVSRSTLKRKGLEIFVRSAKLVPRAKFVIIGKERDDSIDYLKSIASSNVSFTGYVKDEELLKWYQQAKVYVQISAYESFGMSLAEAMLCECVPVVTDRGALLEVVGDTGFLVNYDDEKATANGIEKALNSNKGSIARQRIVDKFTLKKREEALVKTIAELYD
jgi:glycosyltransferase involved in cell wall biosynthesis